MTSHQKQVLYITYNYPPVGGSGVQRGLKFTKYLPDFGWDSIVLTAAPFWVKQPKDRSLMKEVKPHQLVYRTFTLDAQWLYKLLWGFRFPKAVYWLMFHIFIPDAQVLWLPFAKIMIRKIIRLHQPDLVFISGPPFSQMQLGKWISDHFGIPYILDFRDDWSLGQSRLDNPPPAKYTGTEREMEQSAIHNASHVVVVIKSYISDFGALYSHEGPAKFTWIPNGYDESDFTDTDPPKTPKDQRMHIVFTGQMYDRRHPGMIWQALINLVDKGLIDKNHILITIYGKNHESFVYKGFESSAIIRSMVKIHSYLPHSQAIEVMQKADLLLLFSGTGLRSETELTGKFFEYLRAGKPILAVVHPHGASAEVLLRAISGFVADHNDVIQIENTMLTAYRLWLNGELTIDPDWEYIRTFERRNLTAKLAECFNHVLENRS